MPRTIKNCKCDLCPDKKSMTREGLGKHRAFKHREDHAKKDRKINRARKSWCSPCQRNIKRDWVRHRRNVHKDKKEKKTPTFGQLEECEPDVAQLSTDFTISSRPP